MIKTARNTFAPHIDNDYFTGGGLFKALQFGLKWESLPEEAKQLVREYESKIVRHDDVDFFKMAEAYEKARLEPNWDAIDAVKDIKEQEDLIRRLAPSIHS